MVVCSIYLIIIDLFFFSLYQVDLQNASILNDSGLHGDFPDFIETDDEEMMGNSNSTFDQNVCFTIILIAPLIAAISQASMPM